MELHGQNLIAGQTSPGNGTTFRAFDPAKGSPFAPDFHEASENEIAAGTQSAQTAFEPHRTSSPELRARFLGTIAAEIEALGDALLERCHQETALPIARLQGERARTCAFPLQASDRKCGLLMTTFEERVSKSFYFRRNCTKKTSTQFGR